MATSIIDIDVNDEKFKKFQALYEKYQDAVKKLPGDWGKVNETHSTNVRLFADMTAALLAQQELLHKNNIEHEKTDTTLKSSDRTMGGLARHAKSLAGDIASVTKNVLKWAGIGSLLVGGGGLFGLDRIGEAAAGARRSSLGLGTTSGEQQAFELNYSRYLDPTSNLNNIANAKSDWSRRWAFGALGVSDKDVQQKDPAELATMMAIRAKEVFDKSDQSQQFAESHGLLEFYTMDELRRLHAVSMEDLRKSQGSYKTDIQTLAVDPEVQKAWQDFTTQMERAGTSIENTFIRGLWRLAPGLEKLSDDVVKAIDAFMKSDNATKAIDWLGKKALELGDWLASDELKKDIDGWITTVDKFWKSLEKTATDIAGVFAWIEGFLNEKIPKSGSTPDKPEGPELGPNGSPIQGHSGWGFNSKGEWGYRTLTPPVNEAEPEQVKKWKEEAATLPVDYARRMEVTAATATGVPTDFSQLIFAKEGGLNPNGTPRVSSAGAIGAGQLMPGTARDLGVNPYDTQQNIVGSVRYMKQLLEEFHGDREEAAAAYNWGPKNVEDDLKAHGANWKKYLPDETTKYVQGFGGQAQAPGSDELAKVIDRLRRQVPVNPRVSLNINNNTGGSAIVSASQLA